eukprot:3803721-Amphidinium_carterae.1
MASILLGMHCPLSLLLAQSGTFGKSYLKIRFARSCHEAVTLSLDDTEGTGLDVSDSLTLIFGPGVL